MAIVMRLDVVPHKSFLYAALINLFLLIIAIIIGFTGPSVYEQNTYYAYGCPERSHLWNPSTCTGEQLNITGTKWERVIPNIALSNRFWQLQAFPYNNLWETQDISLTLDVEVSLYAKLSNTDSNEDYISIAEGITRKEKVECVKGTSQCSGFLVIYEEFVRYPLYLMKISLPNSDNNYWVGDVKFEIVNGNASFTYLEMGTRMFFMLATLTVLALYGYYAIYTHKLSFSDMNWEQRCLVALLIGVLLYNNPFYPLIVAFGGWFFSFLNSIFVSAFLSVLLLFWLFLGEKMKLEQESIFETPMISYISKWVLVGLHAAMSIILFGWISIRGFKDPVFENSAGVSVLFYFIVILFTILVVWAVIQMSFAYRLVRGKPYLMIRFLFFVVPSVVCIISLFASILAGKYGLVNQDNSSFMYFITLFNLYVYTLAWAYWPIKENFQVGNPTEKSRLVF